MLAKIFLGFVMAVFCFSLSTATSVEPAENENANPTHLIISSRKSQTPEQQQNDLLACYDSVCKRLNWNPFQEYDNLVKLGYAVELTSREQEHGLMSLAAKGAKTGTIAGDLLSPETAADPYEYSDEGAEIGVAIALAQGLLHSDYLLMSDDPQAQRAVARYEHDLRKWETKLASCLKKSGYKVTKHTSAFEN
ncbi:MAG: hypothetical protein GY780_12470 [bacterium]|nr:hypothetical protein [bacterium]